MSGSKAQPPRPEEDIEMERTLADEQSVKRTPSRTGRSYRSAEVKPLESVNSEESHGTNLGLLMDLSLPVSLELGQTELMISEVLDLKRGQIIEFDKRAGDPIDIRVNGKKIAEGEVVIVEKHFGIRITKIVDRPERIHTPRT